MRRYRALELPGRVEIILRRPHIARGLGRHTVMDRYMFGRRERREPRGGGRRRWPRSRAGGCLLWILLLIVVLVILSVMFGGFQKGTKANGNRSPGFGGFDSFGGLGVRVAVVEVFVAPGR
jgi:hypothetical protein